MAGSSDEEMEKLLLLADQISDDFINSINQIETLKSNYNAEIINRQSIELTCSNLKQDNERLKNLHLETLNNLLLELQHRGDSSTAKEELRRLNLELVKKEDDYQVKLELLKKNHDEKVRVLEGEIEFILKQKREELRRMNDDLAKKEDDHRNLVETTKRNYEEKVRVLEGRIGKISGQKREDEATIYQLHHELISTRKKLKEIEVKSKEEIEDLKDCVYVEQQEKGELSKKVRDLEKELFVTKTKVAEHHVLTSDKQLEIMKGKMMKLRKENEVLRRQVIVPKKG